MTAVTTAGLLAGLFGSAFVPAARAAAASTVAFTAAGSNEDKTDTTAKVAYFSTAVYPVVKFTLTTTAAGDDGTYEVTVDGASIRSCVTGSAGITGTSGQVTTSASCSLYVDSDADGGTATFTLTLTKLADGAEATFEVIDPDDDSLTIANADTAEGRATTKLADDLSASDSLDSVALDSEGDGDVDGTHDAEGDVTIGTREYFAPEQDQGAEAVVAGFLLNSYGDAYTTDTVIIAEVSGTGDETVGCDDVVDGAATDSGDALTTLTVDDNSGQYECYVYTDAETAGGAWNLEVKTASGVVVMEYSGGFLGEVASVTITALDNYIGANIDADIDDFVSVVVKDAAGRAYAAADINSLDGETLTAVDEDDNALDDVTQIDGTTAGEKKLDKDICDTDDLDQGDMAYFSYSYHDGAGDDVESNVLTFECGPDGDDIAAEIGAIGFEDGAATPGETVDLNVTLVNSDGDILGYGSEWSNDIDLDISNASDAGDDCGLDDGDIDNTTASTLVVLADGKITCELKVSTTVGAVVLANDPNSSLTSSMIVGTSVEGTLAKGVKKGRVIATFASAPRQVIKFEVENANTGVVRTYSRRASAAGVAKLDIARRGTFYVTAYLATDETSLTDTLTIRR